MGSMVVNIPISNMLALKKYIEQLGGIYSEERDIIEEYMMLAPKEVPLSDDDIVAMVMEDRYGNENNH